MWKQPPPPDLHHYHHHPSTYNYSSSSSSPYPNPQFHPPPPPPPPHHHQQQQPPNNPNFHPNINLPPPPPPDYRLLPPRPFLHRSPNCTPPVRDHVDFMVSWPEPDHQYSLNSNEFRFSSRRPDDREPSSSASFNSRSACEFWPEVGVGGLARRRFDSGMDVDRDRACGYDSAGSEFCRSSGYGGFVQRSKLPMEFKGDRVRGAWGYKRQRYHDALRSVSGARHSEFVRGDEGYVVPRVQRKSALLRILDSSPENGHFSKKPKSSGHSSSKTGPFTVNYSSPAKNWIKKEGENSPRENTPVHVSFKSNSLVAKQLVSPSSPVDITNYSSSLRNKKFIKLASPGMNGLIISSHEENQSSMKLRKSGHSPKNPSYHNNIIELTKVSDCNAVNKKLFDDCASPVKQVGTYDTFSSAENCKSSGDNKLAKCRKKQNLSEYRVPLSLPPVEEKSGGVRSFSPTEVLNYKGSKESCHLMSTSSTETGSLVNTVVDHSHNLLAQHIGEATMESSMKQCGSRQSDSDNQESQLLDDYCYKETVTDTTAVSVNEIGCSEPPRDECIQMLPPEADLVCNTIIDQTCPDGIIEKGILEDRIITLTADDNIKADQDFGFSSTSMKKRKERGTQFNFSDVMPAVKAHENDMFNKVTIDSDNGGCASPDSVGIGKEVTFVMDMGFVPLDIFSTNCDVATTALNKAASHCACDDQSSLVPVSSGSMPLHKDGSNISNLAQGSSLSVSGSEFNISTMKTGSDPEVQHKMASHERMSEGKIISISTQFEHKSSEVALGNATKRVGNSLVKTNLGCATQVDALSSASSDISDLKPSRATTGSSKYPKTYAPHAPFRTSLSVSFASPKVQSSKMHPNKSRTWHRNDNDSTVSYAGKRSGSNSVPVPVPKHTLKSGQPQGTLYIRRGNSLVRNPSPVGTVSRSPRISTCPASLPSSPGIEDKIGFSENKDDINVSIGRNRFGTGSSDNLLNIQKNEAGQSLAKTSPFVYDALPVKSPDMSPTRPMTDFCSETNSYLIRSPESTGLVQLRDEMKLKETTENQNQITLSNSHVTQAAVNKGSCISTNSDCILPSNYDPCQLISASGPSPLTAENAQSNQILSSDSYYKTRMNQIIRTPLDSGQPLLLSKCNLNTEGINAQHMVGRTSTLQSYKGTMHKPSNLSLVWTLKGAQPTIKFTEGHIQGKRPTRWRGVRNSRASLNIRTMSVLRNHNTLYKRSTHGLSLRKYKVVAMGGCSLKWSKSIEKRSKKANEDATRAVLAAESLKRVRSHPQNPMFREVTKHRTSRGRIFHIGSVRYRMDPSRKTLRRVIDDGSACGNVEDKDSKIAYVPTRLAIGKNEYIRIGNGNQLIRDPKKRIRMLANEKIRWSLHNVRQRSLKKGRFCQFYTRFGKCNKEDGKCPYIHDSSKIAVCTKFLRGICSDPDCKLTHKVIPERMEDCSYFLQGMCSNESCPYRHVNVNPKATTCEGFLRGYCADGDECGKKHSYICQIYEETGSCPEGTKCKLHHPKKQKAKHTIFRLQNSSKGRYFAIPSLEVSEPQTVAPLKLPSIKRSSAFEGSKIPEFISLDDSDGGDDDVSVREDFSCSSKHDDNVMDIEAFDLNTFIKPLRIMNKDIGGVNLDNPAIPGS